MVTIFLPFVLDFLLFNQNNSYFLIKGLTPTNLAKLIIFNYIKKGKISLKDSLMG
jgi:hypothetical protein